jgi:hypothetical protein
MQKIIRVSFLSICFLIATSLNAQITSKQTTVFNKTFIAELGGPGVLFSANFDSRFKATERLGWGYRVGVGYFPGEYRVYTTTSFGTNYSYRTKTILSVPLGVNYLFGKANSDKMFEVGAGVTLMSKKVSLFDGFDFDDEYKESNLIGHFSFMYRKQPVDGGYSWRIGFTPIVGSNGQVAFSAAVGLGFCF